MDIWVHLGALKIQELVTYPFVKLGFNCLLLSIYFILILGVFTEYLKALSPKVKDNCEYNEVIIKCNHWNKIVVWDSINLWEEGWVE